MATSQPYHSTVIIATIWDVLMCGAAVVIAKSLPSSQPDHASNLRLVGTLVLGLIFLNALFSIPRIHLDSRRRGLHYPLYKSIVYGLSDFPLLPFGGFSFYRSELKHRAAVRDLGVAVTDPKETPGDSFLLFGVALSIALIIFGLLVQFHLFQISQPVSLAWGGIQITLEIILYFIGGVGLISHLAWAVYSKQKVIGGS